MKTISLKWNAPGLSSAAAAISGSVVSPNNTQKVVLPANQPLNLQVEPGVPVVVRAQMPSGKVIQKTLKFSDDPAALEVVLADPSTSADPSFSIYTCLDALKKSRPEAPPTLPFASSQNLPADSELIESTAEKAFRADTGSRAISFLNSLTNKDVWENLWLRVWSYEKNEPVPWHSHPAPVTPIAFHSGSLIIQLGQLPANRPCFLELGRHSGVSRFVAIPPIDSLQMVIRPSWNPRLFDASGGRTLQFISTNDQYFRLQVALKYIQENAFSEAANLLNDMYSSLIEKADNPFGAAVGGYFLLKFGESGRIAQMARNFYQWHAWLPDSAIIYAWQLMSEDSQNLNDQQHLNHIKDALVEALHRGVPIFTIGLRFLFEQLRQMKSDTSPNTASTTGFSEQVQYLAELLGACDQKQYLATFFGMAPWHATRKFDPSFVVPTENRLPLSALQISWQFDADDTLTAQRAVNAQPGPPAPA